MKCVVDKLNIKPTLESLIDSHIQSGWHAKLSLRFIDRGDKTILKEKQQQGPLTVQRPFYPEGSTCHCYLLHPPSGIVGGDSLHINSEVAVGAKVLITTPAASKFYRSNARYAEQQQIIHVKRQSCLEWLPQENIFFSDAHVRLHNKIYLHQNAKFFGWEMHCFGRLAPNEGFKQGHLIGKTQIYIGDNQILSECINLRGEDNLLKTTGLLNFSMMGTLYISIDDENFYALVQSLLSTLQQEFEPESLLIAATWLEGLVVVRAFGHWSEIMLMAFEQIRKLTRLYWTGVEPDSPRIWTT